jgi:hypothetical protein
VGVFAGPQSRTATALPVFTRRPMLTEIGFFIGFRI